MGNIQMSLLRQKKNVWEHVVQILYFVDRDDGYNEMYN